MFGNSFFFSKFLPFTGRQPSFRLRVKYREEKLKSQGRCMHWWSHVFCFIKEENNVHRSKNILQITYTRKLNGKMIDRFESWSIETPKLYFCWELCFLRTSSFASLGSLGFKSDIKLFDNSFYFHEYYHLLKFCFSLIKLYKITCVSR